MAGPSSKEQRWDARNAELLDYFLCIRGLNTLSDSHDLSMERHYLPIGADVSVPTLSAN